MIRTTNWRAVVFSLPLVSAAFTAPARAQAGQALDWATHVPIEGARIVLDCSRNPWFQPEGVVHLRTVVQVTDVDGRYSFSSRDKLGCSQIAFFAEKEGYSGADGAIKGPLDIPEVLYLIKTTDRVMFDLEHSVPSTGRMVMQKDGTWVPDFNGEYLDVFESFYKAKRIASTPREVAFVHEHFCGRLSSLYARLSDEQKSALVRSDFPGYSYAGKPHAGGSYADYAGEVVAYCERANAAAPESATVNPAH